MISFLCIIALLIVPLSGCAKEQTALANAYHAYSYSTNYLSESVVDEIDFFAKDLCVTGTTNFGTEDTYDEVAKGAGVFNVTTGEVLYNQDIFTQLFPASTTKVLTAYIIIKDCNLGDIVTVSESAVKQADDSSVCGLKAGDRISVNDLLYGLILSSGNDAAEALAEYHSGSVEAFSEVMTKEAMRLGASNSKFTNPSGLPDKEHYTTVYDMYLIFNAAIQQDKFVEIISAKSKNASIVSADGSSVDKTFQNNCRYQSGAVETPKGFTIIGGKTGTTFDAGYCLVLYSKNESGQDIISIVFKADGRHNLYLLMNQILSKFAK